MGATNVAKVFANWRHLSHREARALAFMANMALDADKPPVYFGGWVAVASALGLDCEAKRANAQEQFRRTIAGLATSGAVVSSGQAKLGVRAEYALALDPDMTYEPAGTGRSIKWVSLPRTESPTQKVPHVHPPEGAPPSTQKVPHVHPPEGGERGTLAVPPRSTEEKQGGVLEEKQGGVQITNHSDLTTARTRELAALDERPSLEDERSRQLAALERRIAEQKKAS
ncbi:hypothetical protein [Pseudarthrobacter sp. ATCC 49987]|uniref:hypothetical protein n=1 Tax=Pseudarthrobacter sp. ATCC 49987 TaxID=2698204 RepID=UPI00136D2300|nr:hypothetical protein [Pseudarthrobacter sp. ATCC 49987]